MPPETSKAAAVTITWSPAWTGTPKTRSAPTVVMCVKPVAISEAAAVNRCACAASAPVSCSFVSRSLIARS
jgi:hypothetical protein